MNMRNLCYCANASCTRVGQLLDFVPSIHPAWLALSPTHSSIYFHWHVIFPHVTRALRDTRVQCLSRTGLILECVAMRHFPVDGHQRRVGGRGGFGRPGGQRSSCGGHQITCSHTEQTHSHACHAHLQSGRNH